MHDEQQGIASFDIEAVEAELCRLPDVVAARIVTGDGGRPTEIHVLAHPGKHAKQVVRDVQSVALASFGLELDRRIVSVVQLGPNGASTAQPETTAFATRPAIGTIQAQTTGLRTTVRVTLTFDQDESTGFSQGSVASAMRPRLVAAATLDALRQLEPMAESFEVDSSQIVRVGADDVAVVTVVYADPPLEHSLSGSAIVHANSDDAVVRAVLDATNRRLPFIASRSSRGD